MKRIGTIIAVLTFVGLTVGAQNQLEPFSARIWKNCFK